MSTATNKEQGTKTHPMYTPRWQGFHYQQGVFPAKTGQGLTAWGLPRQKCPKASLTKTKIGGSMWTTRAEVRGLYTYIFCNPAPRALRRRLSRTA